MVDNNLMYPPNDNDDDLCNLLNVEDLLTFSSNNAFPMENFVYIDDTVPAPHPLSKPSHEPAKPLHRDSIPTMRKVETDYAFHMRIDPGKNQNWLKNEMSGKVYIKLNQIMTATVLYKPSTANLFLRAMIVFSNIDDIQRPVKRCANHRIVNEYAEVPLSHIMRCCHPNTKYIGTETAEIFGERLSFLIPLSPSVSQDDGMASETVKLEFLCQNSCLTGMNRKATAVIFTLEDESYKVIMHEIVGKYVMPFKVCSCPRRDMTRDTGPCIKRELSIASQGKMSVKKICRTGMIVEPPKSSTSSSAAFKPVTKTFKMPTKKLLRHVLRCANNEIHGLMAIQITSENAEKYAKYARNVKHLLDAHTDD